VAEAFVDPDFFYDGQEYDLTIHMELPETPQNMNAGMFMVTLDLSLIENTTTFTTSKPVSNCKFLLETIIENGLCVVRSAVQVASLARDFDFLLFSSLGIGLERGNPTRSCIAVRRMGMDVSE
jgi:hypothetical protein